MGKWPTRHCERVDPAFQIKEASLDLFMNSIHAQLQEINLVFQKNLKQICAIYVKQHDTIIKQNVAKCIEQTPLQNNEQKIVKKEMLEINCVQMYNF